MWNRKPNFLRPLVGIIVLCAAMAVALPNHAAADLAPHQEAINQAIEMGCAWLQGAQIQYDAGGVQYGYWDPGYGGGSYVAGTGFALLALISHWDSAMATDPDPIVDDEHIRRAVNYILATQLPDGTWGGNQNYQASAAVMGLAAVLAKLPPGSPSIGPVQTAIENGKNWLVASQWDESCLWGSVNPSDDYFYGGFGYGSWNRPDLSNSQFSLVALKAAFLDPMADTWAKAAMYIEKCQYKLHNDGGMWYTPDYPAWGPGSTGSMTGAGVWGYRLCGVPVADSRVQDALGWLDANYTYTQNAAGDPDYSHYYYLWSAAKAFLICDIKGEIGGLIPVEPEDALLYPWFYSGWYYDFSKYLVSQQQPDGHWNTFDYNGGPMLDTEYALFILQKAVGICNAVQVSIYPDSVAVKPGDTAMFTVTIHNLGTCQDSFDMDVLGLPSGFSWAMEDPVMDVPGEDTAQVPLGIITPPDLAIWVDTPYPFSVEGTSLTDSLISHATSAEVVIIYEPGPGNRVRYVDSLLSALIAQVEAANIQHGVKNSLLAKLTNAEHKKHQGLARLEEGDTAVAMNMFNAAANMLGAFVNEVQAQRGKKITEGDAASFIAQAEDIIWRLEEGIWFEMVPPASLMAGEGFAVPSEFALEQNYPNPFNASTEISFSLVEAGAVQLAIYDVLGRKVCTLVDGFLPAGRHMAQWDGKDAHGDPVASGMYFYRLTAGALTETRKMALLK